MAITDDVGFEVRVTKQVGDGFGVAVEVTSGSVSERDAVLRSIELLVVHLENEIGLRSWDAGVEEGLRQASE